MNATSTKVVTKHYPVNTSLRHLRRFVMISGVAILAAIAIYAGTKQPPTLASYAVVVSLLLALFSVNIFIAFKSNVWFLVPIMNLAALILTPTVFVQGAPTWLAWCLIDVSLLLLLAALDYTDMQREVIRTDVWGPPQAFWKGPLRYEQSRSHPRLSELEHRVLRHPDEASGQPATLLDASPLTKAAQIFAALPQAGAAPRRHQRPVDPHTLFLKQAARIKPGEEDTFIDTQIESFRYRASLLEPCNTEEASLWLGYAQALKDVQGIWGVPVTIK